jgi:hypothetical protein
LIVQEIHNLHSLIPRANNDPTDEASESRMEQQVLTEHNEDEEAGETGEGNYEEHEEESDDEEEFTPSARVDIEYQSKRRHDLSEDGPSTRPSKRARVELSSERPIELAPNKQPAPSPPKEKKPSKRITYKTETGASLPKMRKPVHIVTK